MIDINDKRNGEYLIMVDKNNRVMQIDWASGGVLRPAEQQEFVTAWSYPQHDKHLMEITIQNMQKIISLNVGLGLRIAKMTATFAYEELKTEEANEPKPTENLIH